jgi:hypothetical protein
MFSSYGAFSSQAMYICTVIATGGQVGYASEFLSVVMLKPLPFLSECGRYLNERKTIK